MYQPRGVGLMHTRRKPSDAYYTHAGAGQRKCPGGNKSATTRKDYSPRHLSRSANLSHPPGLVTYLSPMLSL